MNRLRQFMYGRYGADQLGMALVILGCVVTFVLSLFRSQYQRFFVSLLLRLVSLIPYLLFLFRALSKDIDRRRAENERFLKYWLPLRSRFVTKAAHLRDKEHRYFKCPGCSRTLRVPKGKGKIEISCPHCQRKFKKRT